MSVKLDLHKKVLVPFSCHLESPSPIRRPEAYTFHRPATVGISPSPKVRRVPLSCALDLKQNKVTQNVMNKVPCVRGG